MDADAEAGSTDEGGRRWRPGLLRRWEVAKMKTAAGGWSRERWLLADGAEKDGCVGVVADGDGDDEGQTSSTSASRRMVALLLGRRRWSVPPATVG